MLPSFFTGLIRDSIDRNEPGRCARLHSHNFAIALHAACASLLEPTGSITFVVDLVGEAICIGLSDSSFEHGERNFVHNEQCIVIGRWALPV